MPRRQPRAPRSWSRRRSSVTARRNGPSDSSPAWRARRPASAGSAPAPRVAAEIWKPMAWASVALADARRRLGDQQREDRGEQEAEGEEAGEGARAASRQAHDERGQGRAGHAEAEEGRRRHVVGDRAEGQASREDAAPVGGRGEARGGGRHPARLREQAEGPLAGARLGAGVEEEDERVARARAARAARRAGGPRRTPRSRRRPLAAGTSQRPRVSWKHAAIPSRLAARSR